MEIFGAVGAASSMTSLEYEEILFFKEKEGALYLLKALISFCLGLISRGNSTYKLLAVLENYVGKN